MDLSRRDVLRTAGAGAVVLSTARASAAQQAPPSPTAGSIRPEDRVFIANEDSNTISVIDPRTNLVDTTINLTSFDEDPRPPFRLVTGGVTPAHVAMIGKPLYHGAIGIHGVAPSPDNRYLATSGRGSSNVYLIDATTKQVVGNAPNPQASGTTNAERVSSGIFVGREPHEPTFTRNGKELFVAVRGEDRIAIMDVAAALHGDPPLTFVATINGPAQVWFSRDGRTAFIVSQKVARIDVWSCTIDGEGRTRPSRRRVVDITAQDPFGFTPFLKTSPDGAEVWMSHKLADRVSAVDAAGEYRAIDSIPLGALARPNHVEFVENPAGKVVYASLARVDDGGPGGVASSQVAVIDRAARPGQRQVVATFFTHGREAHGLWTNPENSLLYVSHEQDALPGTPHAGETLASAFDVTDPLRPRFIAQIPLGALKLPSGALRNKKSINLVYVRPGSQSQAA